MAVQSAQLRQHLRAVPGVPVIHFNERGVMVMEMPSDATLKQKDRVCTTTLLIYHHPLADDCVL